MTDGKRIALVIAGLAATFALLSRRLAVAGDVLTAATVRAFADSAVSQFGFNVDPRMIVRIASIESSFSPSAIRYEPAIGDASAGLMQTLVSTARWLATDRGYTAYGVPTLDSLLRSPQESIYFGAAYLNYLSRYAGQARTEEWIVRSYNGGPGNTGAATNNYWRKYQDAKRELG
jgi:soluble lytic murein transglycosylase-like protein